MDQNSEEYQKIGFKEFYNITKWALGMLYSFDKTKTILWIGTAIIQQSQDFLYTLIFAKAIDALIKVAQTPDAHISSLYPYLGIILAYNLLISVFGFLRGYAASSLRMLSRPKIRQSFYYKLNKLGIQTLEQPDINDKMHRADDYLGNMMPYLGSAVQAIASIIKTIASFFIVLGFMPIFTPIIILTSVPYLFFDRWIRRKIYKVDYENTEKRRAAGSCASNLTNPAQMHEISLTGAFSLLDKKYITFYDWLNTKMLKIMNQGRSGSYAFGFVTDAVILMGYIELFKKLIVKVISVGDVVFWMRTLNIFQNSLSDTMQYLNDLWENSVQLKDTYILYQTKPVYKEGHIVLPKWDCGPVIEFKDVCFKYPRNERNVIQNLNLKINRGEKLAIVGQNGAGKTTLIKLISRLYPVTEGILLINNININDIKSESLFQNIGVLFQDFNIYPQLTVKENIAIGKPDVDPDELKIRIAAQTADAMDFINAYPNKFDQILSERYKGGIRPSTGQWQKIAIARFFYRNAPLVIFDEPTASIDAVSEYHIFNKIYEFFENKTVIIISHRFSTVRNADRIIVMDDGKIIEEGKHNDLMTLNGRYAEAFLLQAKGYEQ